MCVCAAESKKTLKFANDGIQNHEEEEKMRKKNMTK